MEGEGEHHDRCGMDHLDGSVQVDEGALHFGLRQPFREWTLKGYLRCDLGNLGGFVMRDMVHTERLVTALRPPG